MVLYCEHKLLGVKKKTKPFLHLSLGKAGPFTLESHICVKALKCKLFQIIRCLIKPLLKNSTQTIFQGDTSWLAQLLNNIIVWMVLYCEHQLLGVKKNTKPVLHPFLGKAGPFTLESHICVKALKCKLFQIIRCLMKPFLKNSTQTIFQGDTSWLAQLLNNIIVWVVLYCEHQLLGVKKIERKLKLIKSNLKSIESKLKSIESKLKVNWNQLIKSELKSIESKLKSIESKLKVNGNPYLSWLTQKLLGGAKKKVRVIEYHQIVWRGPSH